MNTNMSQKASKKHPIYESTEALRQDAKIILIARSEDGAHEVISQWTGTGQMARYGHLRGLVSDRPWSRWIGLGFVERLLQNVNSSPAHCIHFKSGV